MLQTISQISAKNRASKAVVEAVTSHVLLVKDDSQLTQLIAQELGCEGYQVSLTEDGISGLIAARQTNPHLVVLFSKGWRISSLG